MLLLLSLAKCHPHNVSPHSRRSSNCPPLSPSDKVFFCNSGAEANESAIKLSRKWASSKGATHPIIIAAKGSFHGRTLGALAATGQDKYHQGFKHGSEVVPGFAHVPYNDIGALRKAFKECNTRTISDRVKGRKRAVAAVLVEAIQGEGGIIPGDKKFFEAARELCDEHGALLICDEVQVSAGLMGAQLSFFMDWDISKSLRDS